MLDPTGIKILLKKLVGLMYTDMKDRCERNCIIFYGPMHTAV